MRDSDRKRWDGGDRRSPGERRQKDRRSGVDRRTKSENAAEKGRRSDADWQPVTIDAAAVASTGAEQALLAAAIDARTRAQAAYSGFMVGAALETAEGQVIGGCNIENATYGLTVCAERVAMFKALSEGHRTFRRIAVVADTASPTPPCGACRQILWEFGGDLEVVLANLRRQTGMYRLAQLLPLPFDARLL